LPKKIEPFLFVSLVILLHALLLTWLRQPDLPSKSQEPAPFNVEVTLLGSNNTQPTKTATPPAPSPAKINPIPEAKKTPPVKEKPVDIGEIEKLIKSQSTKQLTRKVNVQPDQQKAQAVSAAMVMPPSGKPSARDNFPISDLHNPSPEYPEMGVFLGYQGDVIIRIRVSAKGDSVGVEILRSSGHKVLDDSAVNALRKWRFRPTKHDNTPMNDSVIITVSYVLYDRNR
jgi:protein TonB